jgi:hypothetical protein
MSNGQGNVGLYLDGGKTYNAGLIQGSSAYSDAQTTFFDSVKFGPASGSQLIFNGHVGNYGFLRGTIEGFNGTDVIQVVGPQDELTKSGNLDGSYQIATPKDGTLYFGGNYTGEHFQLTQLTVGSTVVTDITLVDGPCFATGTLIHTPHGERRVETLRIGDLVTTLRGAAKPVRWIGRRHYSQCTAAQHGQVLPIRICADALASGQPRRVFASRPNTRCLSTGCWWPRASW